MSSMKKQEEQTKNICLLKKDRFTLYLVKEGDSFTDIKNGVVSILPEELIAKRKSGGNISTDIENYAHKLKRQEYGKKLNYQIENLLFLTGAGSSYLFGENDKKGKLMCNLWDDSEDVICRLQLSLIIFFILLTVYVIFHSSLSVLKIGSVI